MIQYSGDYRSGFIQLQSGGGETYHSQRYSHEKTAEIGRKYGMIGVLCCLGEKPYDEVMDDGVRAMGAGLSGADFRTEPILAKIREFQPTNLIVGGPFMEVIRWAIHQNIDTLPCFADSFTLSTTGISPIRALARTAKHQLHCLRLARLLNSPRIRWVANHNVPACRDLERIGVNPQKIVPWDYMHMTSPDMYDPKPGPADGAPWHLVFVGGVSELKGVGDAIDAVAELKRRGRNVELNIIGQGDLDELSARARDSGVAERVHFEGLQTNAHVMESMRASDLVVVPSHHRYPEGLPFVFYEAFATRTPVLCSDHPMFRGIVSEDAAMLVPEKRSDKFADAVIRILCSPDLYRRMSVSTKDAWLRIQCPVLWDELIDHFLGASDEDDRWLAQYSLGSRRYSSVK
ncbi:MAG: glycosyltransferase family 4 protein [Isosphaeraceae bacterium]